jgi:hypothetical protein
MRGVAWVLPQKRKEARHSVTTGVVYAPIYDGYISPGRWVRAEYTQPEGQREQPAVTSLYPVHTFASSPHTHLPNRCSQAAPASWEGERDGDGTVVKHYAFNILSSFNFA